MSLELMYKNKLQFQTYSTAPRLSIYMDCWQTHRSSNANNLAWLRYAFRLSHKLSRRKRQTAWRYETETNPYSHGLHCQHTSIKIITSITGLKENLRILTYLHASRDDFHPGLFYTPHSQKNMAATKAFVPLPLLLLPIGQFLHKISNAFLKLLFS